MLYITRKHRITCSANMSFAFTTLNGPLERCIVFDFPLELVGNLGWYVAIYTSIYWGFQSSVYERIKKHCSRVCYQLRWNICDFCVGVVIMSYKCHYCGCLFPAKIYSRDFDVLQVKEFETRVFCSETCRWKYLDFRKDRIRRRAIKNSWRKVKQQRKLQQQYELQSHFSDPMDES